VAVEQDQRSRDARLVLRPRRRLDGAEAARRRLRPAAQPAQLALHDRTAAFLVAIDSIAFLFDILCTKFGATVDYQHVVYFRFES